jgi:NAD(P)-dependent dehydrogenase (short-subunit alcohol dehydrogenase family)
MKVGSVVVTGCTRGLGRALTEWFLARGIGVSGCGRSAEAIESVRMAAGGRGHFSKVDVGDRGAVDEWAATVVATSGAPDLLINNAAITASNAPFWKVPAEEFDAVIDVNVRGLANVTRAFLPAMIARGRGVVVNVSSGWGRSTSPEVAAYCASKWAVEGFSQALAQELPRGLAVVALNPGIIDTDMLTQCFGAAASNYPSPSEWVRSAGPFLEAFGPEHNGRALTVPGAMV